MRRVSFAAKLAALVIALVPISSASAYASSPNWSGFYVGVNAGYAWGNSDASSVTACGLLVYFLCPNQALVQAAGSGSISSSGFTGGAQAGYNWQSNNLIWGVETDFSSLNLRGSKTRSANYVTLPADTFTASFTDQSNWLVTARARIGWAVSQQMLFYGTGGLAWTRLAISNAASDNVPVVPGAGASASSGLKTGWTIGAGAEWMLTNNWTFKAEYLYVNFGNVSTTAFVLNPGFPTFVSPYTTSADLTAQIARVGINYRF